MKKIKAWAVVYRDGGKNGSLPMPWMWQNYRVFETKQSAILDVFKNYEIVKETVAVVPCTILYSLPSKRKITKKR